MPSGFIGAFISISFSRANISKTGITLSDEFIVLIGQTVMCCLECLVFSGKSIKPSSEGRVFLFQACMFLLKGVIRSISSTMRVAKLLLKDIVSSICVLFSAPSGSHNDSPETNYPYIYKADCGPTEIHLFFPSLYWSSGSCDCALAIMFTPVHIKSNIFEPDRQEKLRMSRGEIRRSHHQVYSKMRCANF